MLYSLPTESKIDIFKFLGYADLCSIKRTNKYFRDFIYEFEGDLALEEFYEISIDYFHRIEEYSHKLIKPKAENFNFSLNEQLEKKWENGLENPIPLYSTMNSNKNVVIWLSKDYEGQRLYLLLQLPTIIKSKEDIKIVYYFLNKLFNCSFEYGDFNEFIFNPKLIELLFGNSKRFFIQKCFLYMDYFGENKLEIALGYLCVSGTLTITFHKVTFHEGIEKATTDYTDNLFKILMKGDKFKEVTLNSNNLQKLFDIIINHIETSTISSKMVANIELNNTRINLTSLNGRAENIEDDHDDDDYLTTKYQLSNKFNPKIKYSISYKEELEELIIKRIYC